MKTAIRRAHVVTLQRVLLVLVAAGLTAPASAYACNPMAGGQNDWPTSHSKGWLLDPGAGNNWQDVDARMIVDNPFVYELGLTDPSQNGSYSWIMLVAPSSGSLAQFGPFVDDQGDHWAFMYCWSAGNGPTEILDSEKPDGYTVADEVKYDAGGSKSALEDGTGKGTCNYTFTPLEAQEAGEVQTISDQIPGNTSDHQTWTDAFVTNNNGVQHNLFSSSGTAAASNPGSWIGFSESNSADTMDVWDTRC
jgi:hypothetical protein